LQSKTNYCPSYKMLFCIKKIKECNGPFLGRSLASPKHEQTQTLLTRVVKPPFWHCWFGQLGAVS